MWPEWWEWELAFTGHAERRMEQRGVSNQTSTSDAS
jgi:hypothetical protein